MEDSRGATTAAPSAEPGPRTDRIELLQELSGGSVGTVHKARNPKLNRTVALRQVQVPEWLDDVDDLIKRILAEARAASVLDHPNIARLFTGGYKGFTVFLTSEFVEGINIRDYAASHNLGVAEVVALGKQLCSALDSAHQKNVVHHALDTANLKVLPDGRLKVLDFGLLRDKHLYSPTPAKRLQSEHYLSPEQLKNKPITQAANVFSAATILYELLTTRNPFAGKHLGEVDRNIAEIDPVPASQAHGRVSDALSRVLMKALAKHPLARYQSCGDFGTALEDALTTGPGKAASVSPASVSTTAPAPALPKPPTPPANGINPVIKPTPASAANGQPVTDAAQATAVAGPPSSNGSTQVTSAPQKPMPPVRPKPVVQANTGPVQPPIKMPVKLANQWRFVGGIFVAVFVVSALAISFSHRSKIPTPVESTPVPEPTAAAPEKAAMATVAPSQPAQADPTSEATADATPDVAPDTTVDLRESHSRTSRQHRGKAELQPASTADGVLAISSEPEGAAFSIQGRTTDEWKTPQVVGSLAPAVYKVTVSKAGYSTETRNVQVLGGNRVSLDVKLTALKATLTISGTPLGARIVIDGKETGKFSPAELILDPAVHTITLRREGFFDSSSQIKLVAGQAASYAPSLTPEGRTDNIKVVGGFKKIFGKSSSAGMALMEIKTDPKGAEVSINGSSIPKVTPVEIQLEPGNYQVVLRKDGYQPVRRALTVEPDDKVKIDEQLQR